MNKITLDYLQNRADFFIRLYLNYIALIPMTNLSNLPPLQTQYEGNAESSSEFSDPDVTDINSNGHGYPSHNDYQVFHPQPTANNRNGHPPVSQSRVPRLIGQNIEVAERYAEGAVWKLIRRDVYPIDSSEPNGTVLNQEPKPDTPILFGGIVLVDVSLRPSFVTRHRFKILTAALVVVSSLLVISLFRGGSSSADGIQTAEQPVTPSIVFDAPPGR